MRIVDSDVRLLWAGVPEDDRRAFDPGSPERVPFGLIPRGDQHGDLRSPGRLDLLVVARVRLDDAPETVECVAHLAMPGGDEYLQRGEWPVIRGEPRTAAVFHMRVPTVIGGRCGVEVRLNDVFVGRVGLFYG